MQQKKTFRSFYLDYPGVMAYSSSYRNAIIDAQMTTEWGMTNLRYSTLPVEACQCVGTCEFIMDLSEPLSGPAADVQLARFAKALGHPVRVQILRLLAAQEYCVHGDIASHFPLAPSTIAEHLKVLKEAELVRGEIDGPRVCYCVNLQNFERLKRLLDALNS